MRQGRGALRSGRWREGRAGLPDLRHLGLGTWETVSQGSERKRKVSRDWHSEPHVKASQAACDLALSCSIQGTSGGLALSWLFPAAAPPLPTLCQTLNSERPFIFPSSFLEKAESGFSFLCGSQEQHEKF